MGSVRTPTLERPRPSTRQRRAVCLYTLICEEPDYPRTCGSYGDPWSHSLHAKKAGQALRHASSVGCRRACPALPRVLVLLPPLMFDESLVPRLTGGEQLGRLCRPRLLTAPSKRRSEQDFNPMPPLGPQIGPRYRIGGRYSKLPGLRERIRVPTSHVGPHMPRDPSLNHLNTPGRCSAFQWKQEELSERLPFLKVAHMLLHSFPHT